jgi:hypothetical protein
MTAVEYLVEQLMPKALTAEQYYHIEQAKEMEKKQQGYSEEEVLMIVNRFRIWSLSHVEKKELIDWFEQFKNN